MRSTRILPDRPLSPPGPGRLEKVAVGLVGIAAFLVFVGHRALIPDNIAWLDFGDPAQHFLGWHFFRSAPWTFPPGLNPPYGLEVSSSIVYSDSIPLLALLLKPLSPVLPPVFQYFGFWLLACFMLQAWFGWKLAGLLTRQPVARVLVATLFATALPMVERTHHHLALSGHFILLAALYLALRPVRRHQDAFWALLLVTAALVNAYLLVMAAALWASDLASRLILRREDWRRLVLPAVATIAAILLALWLAGYFSEGEPGTAGFGLFRFNLLSLVDGGRWSSLVPDIPGGPGDPEGFAFLGLGGLALAAVAIAILATGRAGIGRPAARFPFLVAVLALLAIYAMSNEIGIGPLSLFVPLPPAVAELTGVFRASGRMIWPAYYALLLAIAYLVLRGTGRRLAVPLLALALVVQLADFLGPWWAERTRMMAEPSSRWETKLDDPFWEAA
ncbi:MAG: hypothetical protein J0H08_13050, partial [Rhizobiales bacterium]|nr:hypothetical protein [Hyphomicrobiales bacterium]